MAGAVGRSGVAEAGRPTGERGDPQFPPQVATQHAAAQEDLYSSAPHHKGLGVKV